MTMVLPTRLESISEEKINDLSVSECIALREEIRRELRRYFQTNPGVLNRFLTKVNERLTEQQLGTVELYDAYEG